ncbi:DMT family transporter [Pasteurella skyensis]|uniref:DMT family transporter n=1 Tax=Phocoenobacter skyensis TaxID=97481 RepID=A0AAJ6NZY3_9PAST|nr:DMT family transporter [Pasteurella skyensis]MDP8161849.1 DMT family transporter [Pasteurella skyensis]MDP8172005.1 DMT family transporter [Pasteurella skyensis]MDP8176240.1 DMT family transporter [Pasteurella skyensis]MDP8178260.1 DMT family transporter [Pasteurella skyensis]MDP8182132.1 DMT family transporter [Pasteurella skyensis]
MQQRPLIGFLLALLATSMWGAVPIAVQQVLKAMSPTTIVWYRFLVAGLGLFIILGLSKNLPKLVGLSFRQYKFIVLGIMGLSLNFFLFSSALQYISPTTTQVLSQLAPFTMMVVSVLLFRESFGTHQKIGFVLLVVGLIIFFHNQFDEILQFGSYALGMLFGTAAAMIWVLYAISQKLLLARFNSQQVLFIIYIGCAIVFSGVSEPSQFTQLSGVTLACFIFCCLNTLVGYGAYAEALNNWDASKVSAITVLIPIFTMLFSNIGYYSFPDIFADPQMSFLSYIGAFIVVSGTIISVLGHKLVKKNRIR